MEGKGPEAQRRAIWNRLWSISVVDELFQLKTMIRQNPVMPDIKSSVKKQ